MNDRSGLRSHARRITLEHLRAFVGVVEGGGFQNASRDLCRTQSAVTQSLQKLEDILDCRLLERRQGHVVGLTDAGERLLPSAREILARLSDAVATLQKPELSGRIALGVPDDFKVADIHGAISRCLGLNPRLRIEVMSVLSSQVAHLLKEGLLDVGLLKTTVKHRQPVAGVPDERILRVEPLHWVANDRVHANTFYELPIVTFPDGCAYRQAALEALGAAGRHTYFSYVSASYENIRSAVSAGLGIGVLPHGAIARDHVVLGVAEGFPNLPAVQLRLIVRSRGVLFERFADFLQGSSALEPAIWSESARCAAPADASGSPA
jgi:DNA-binding transcriptional LysR family regulator